MILSLFGPTRKKFALAPGTIETAPPPHDLPHDSCGAGRAGLSLTPVNPQGMLVSPRRPAGIQVGADRASPGPDRFFQDFLHRPVESRQGLAG